MSNPDQLNHLRHSAAHLLAAAVLKLYPHALPTIGPSIEDGFYYDFDFGDTKISPEDLDQIEKEMLAIVSSWQSFERQEVSPDEAKKFFANNPYKLELIEEIITKNEPLTFYKSGDFTDLCRGGHCLRPYKDLKHFKLLSVAGAYWRGDEKKSMLTRIYGTCYPNATGLAEHLTRLEEAKKRDHKKLGVELDLFTFSPLVGSGLPLWTPKGMIVRSQLDNFVWQLRSIRGYEKVEIPHITKKDLYETSGHWDKFKDELFRITTREGHEFAMKPMNCPHHTQIYARKKWSYRELPQRYANTTACYRDEQSGELAGLSRVRAFAQDDAHVFCRLSQAQAEFLKIWDIIHEFYPVFGFQLQVRLSLHDPQHPEKYLGDESNWQQAESMLRQIVTDKQADWYEGVGEAAFYGPKLDFMARDALGRQWQVATIQLDFNMPQRFDLTCVNEQGQDERIVMIHAAIMGSIERFLSILIEHTAGNFPVWLAPVQVRVLPISDKVSDYANQIFNQLQHANLRAELDTNPETLGNKIRLAQADKVPYMIVVGEKEAQTQTISLRTRSGQQAQGQPLEQFMSKLQSEISSRALELSSI